MNILEICFSRSGGGLELYMANIARYLMLRGHHILSVAPKDSFLHRQLNRRDVPFLPLSARFRYADVFTARKVAKIIRERKIDIVHAHQSADLSTLLLSVKIAGRGRVVFTQQMESSRKKTDIFHRWVYKNIAGVIGITERVRKQVVENTPIDPSRAYRLYYGIEVPEQAPTEEMRAEARKTWGIAADELVVGIVGRLEEGKGQHIVIKAFAALADKNPKAKLMIVGGETVGQTGYLQKLEQLAAELNLKDKIIFTGFRDDIPVITRCFDICVLATKKETFGLSLIESMATEVAPIGTNAGGVPEIIQDGHNGLLVPPHEPRALAQAMLLLAENDSLRKRMAQEARKTVLEKFNLDQHLQGLEQIFQQISEMR
ncbi:MAG: glycosyltransferase family 4 protein [Calditrichia bacterium]